tara:strand:- start:47 stop:232 length:186 start_codon:yes stop_codon:yes gene_type:complete
MKKHWGEPDRLFNVRQSPPCIICGEISRKRKMCQKHYQRWRKHGDPQLVKKSNGALIRVAD